MSPRASLSWWVLLAGCQWSLPDPAWRDTGVDTGASDTGVTPPEDAPSTPRFIRVALGGSHTCGVAEGGRLFCWGNNHQGQLGDGTSENRSRPTQVPGLSDVRDVTAGEGHTCALLGDGAVYCWGANGHGQLGIGSFEDRLTPTRTSLLGVRSVVAGGDHTCATVLTGLLYCWGRNQHGQVGDGASQDRERPTAVANGLGILAVSGVALGRAHTCALVPTTLNLVEHACVALVPGTELRCWGANDRGQLGLDQRTDHPRPTRVPALNVGCVSVSGVSAGGATTCAALATGALRCWGENDRGQVGDGTTMNRPSPSSGPTVLAGTGRGAPELGDAHACLLLQGDGLLCWGSNQHGQSGSGSREDALTPTRVFEPGLVTEVIAGGEHTCARNDLGQLSCWGRNDSGQLGDGTTDDRVTPPPFAP